MLTRRPWAEHRRRLRDPCAGQEETDLLSRGFNSARNNIHEQGRLGLDGRSTQSLHAELLVRRCGDSHHFLSGSPNSRSCGAS